jgi:hypothetical protein
MNEWMNDGENQAFQRETWNHYSGENGNGAAHTGE